MKRKLFGRKGCGARKEFQGGLWWRLRKNYLMFSGWGEPGRERGGGPAPVRPGEPHWGWRPGVPLPSPPRLLRPTTARAGPAQGTPFPQRWAVSRPPRNGWPEITFRSLPSSVADPGSGIRCLFDPWTRFRVRKIGFFRISDPGSQPHIFRAWWQIFG